MKGSHSSRNDQHGTMLVLRRIRNGRVYEVRHLLDSMHINYSQVPPRQLTAITWKKMRREMATALGKVK